MSINTKMRLTLLASAFALAAAAPAAFAQGAGTWYQGIHIEARTGAADLDNPPASHTRAVMEKKIVPSNVASDTGTWNKDIHIVARTGAADLDNPPASHTKYIMEKKLVPSTPARNQVDESKRYGPNS